ncbi:restriction endonuclease subunit S, partial [Vibrio vulnificus]
MAVENLITEHIDIWTSAVKTKSTSGRGSSKKLELYGVKKLRELILELAVQGKLVPQDPNDEPASVLLKRIAQEKAQLVKEKKLKKPKKLPNISDEEKPFDLPNGWSWIRLNEYGEWGSGSTPKRSNSGYYDGGIPWFKSGELKADYISESEETITELALSETSVRYNNVGDVLVAMYGATIGKTAILSVRATTNQAVCACTPFTGLSNTYLLTLLKAYKARLIGMGAGGAQPNISREKIINTVIALPSTAEQHRIVAKVDELMTLCDQLEQQTAASIEAHQVLVTTLLETLTNSADANELMQNWARISEHFDTLFTTEESIDQLKQTILQLAVMGKLVPQDPNDEPASELLKRIAEEKAQLVKEKK